MEISKTAALLGHSEYVGGVITKFHILKQIPYDGELTKGASASIVIPAGKCYRRLGPLFDRNKND